MTPSIIIRIRGNSTEVIVFLSLLQVLPDYYLEYIVVRLEFAFAVSSMLMKA